MYCLIFWLSYQGVVHLKELHPHFLPLPKYVSQIAPGPNYDYYSSTMRFTISSPVVCQALLPFPSDDGFSMILLQSIFTSRVFSQKKDWLLVHGFPSKCLVYVEPYLLLFGPLAYTVILVNSFLS